MCIRDSLYGGNIQVHAPGYRARSERMPLLPLDDADQVVLTASVHPDVLLAAKRINTCLLYTSDAADERSSVDLGGRRIIKKKKR